MQAVSYRAGLLKRRRCPTTTIETKRPEAHNRTLVRIRPTRIRERHQQSNAAYYLALRRTQGTIRT